MAILTLLALAAGLTGRSPAAKALHLTAIDRIADTAIQTGKAPGLVVVVGHDGRIAFDKAYGMRTLEPAGEAMTPNTIFDLASLTKVLVTAPAVMQLYEQGRLRLDDPVAKYLPAFAANGKAAITIRQMLTHTSGLAPDLSLDTAWSGKQEAFQRAFAAIPISPPGVRFRYSDINYIVLGALIERLSGLPLDQYAENYILHPIGLEEMRFLPPPDWRTRIAPTEYGEEKTGAGGTVYDPTARRMGGVAGDAGLFASGHDVAIYVQSLLDRLQGRPSRFPLKESALRLMITPVRIESRTGATLRGLGWDIDSVYSSPRGKLFPLGSFGHTGYTGTSVWIDPASNTYVIILSNSVYPHGHTDLRALRSGIATSVAAALH